MCNDSTQIPVLAKMTYDFTYLAGTATQTVVLLPYVDVSGYYRAHILVRLHASQMSAGQKLDFELDHTLPSDEDPAEFIDRGVTGSPLATATIDSTLAAPILVSASATDLEAGLRDALGPCRQQSRHSTGIASLYPVHLPIDGFVSARILLL